MPVLKLTRKELAKRWCVDEKTLRNWDVLGKCPPLNKISPRKSFYYFVDVLTFEALELAKAQLLEAIRSIYPSKLTTAHSVNIKVDLICLEPENFKENEADENNLH